MSSNAELVEAVRNNAAPLMYDASCALPSRVVAHQALLLASALERAEIVIAVADEIQEHHLSSFKEYCLNCNQGWPCEMEQLRDAVHEYTEG